MSRRRFIVGAALAAVLAGAAFVAMPRLLFSPRAQPDARFKLATAVTVYDIDGHRDYSDQDIANSTAVTMDAAQFRELVTNAEHTYRGARWKGSSLVVATLDDGAESHLAVSYYGGFFEVVGEPGYWEMPEPNRAKFEDAFMAIIQEQFIPARLRKAP